MEENTVRITLSMIGPLMLLVFALAFVGAWLLERGRDYLLLLAAACVLFMLGFSSQLLWIPPYRGANAMASASCYTGAVILAVEGILRRSGKTFGWGMNVIFFAATLTGLWYFFYVRESLLARIYIQNFAYGLIMLAGALRLSSLMKGKLVDSILFWVLLVFAVQFFPRTLLTIGFSTPPNIKAFAFSPFWQFLQLSVTLLGVCLAFAVLAAVVSDVMDDLRQARDIDDLTGILNRKGFERRIASAMNATDANGMTRRASLILCDIDHFKLINDNHGHDVGDAALRMFGAILFQNVQAADIVGRLGGEEFAIFLPDADIAVAAECAERLRAMIATSLFPIPGKGKRVTASFGVTGIANGDGWLDIYRRADERLYQAKAHGRNGVAT